MSTLLPALVVALAVAGLLAGCALVERLTDRLERRHRPRPAAGRTLRAVASDDVDELHVSGCRWCGGRP